MDISQGNIFERDTKKYTPLAERMRPRDLDEFVGQDHLVGERGILKKLIEMDAVTSMILWGPPGVGKTTLAKIMARRSNAIFESFSAVMSGVKEIREVMRQAEERRRYGKRTLLFIDEIHRFNKSQQDAFLHHVEKGDIILIGATTENPSFELNSALLSRSKVFVMKNIDAADLIKLLRFAVKDEERGLGKMHISVSDDLLSKISVYADGDARIALTTLELASLSSTPDAMGVYEVTDEVLENVIQKKTLLYDKQGEEHFNIVSALHKSVRNSDCDAALYWLARMLEAGEDPLYIARRLVRFASEDIGLADPNAMVQAVTAFHATHFLGMPECATSLAQVVVYLSLSPKSNSLYAGYNKAKIDASNTMALGVPLALRNAPTNLMKEMGYGQGYKYAHDFEKKTVKMQCLPDNLTDRQYYFPSSEGKEEYFRQKKSHWEQLRKETT